MLTVRGTAGYEYNYMAAQRALCNSVHCKNCNVIKTPNLLYAHTNNGRRCEYGANLVCLSLYSFYSVVIPMVQTTC